MQYDGDTDASEEEVDNMDDEDDPFLNLGLHVHRDGIEQQHACLLADESDGEN